MDRHVEALERVEQLEAALRRAEFVVFASMSRGYLSGDYELTEKACKALGTTHPLLGITPQRDEARCVFDVTEN